MNSNNYKRNIGSNVTHIYSPSIRDAETVQLARPNQAKQTASVSSDQGWNTPSTVLKNLPSMELSLI